MLPPGWASPLHRACQISLSELKLEYTKAHRNAYGERMTEAQERQLERRLTKLCQMD